MTTLGGRWLVRKLLRCDQFKSGLTVAPPKRETSTASTMDPLKDLPGFRRTLYRATSSDRSTSEAHARDHRFKRLLLPRPQLYRANHILFSFAFCISVRKELRPADHTHSCLWVCTFTTVELRTARHFHYDFLAMAHRFDIWLASSSLCPCIYG